MPEYTIAEKGELILASDMRGYGSLAQVCKERGIPYETARGWVRDRDSLGFPKSDTIALIKDQWVDKGQDLVARVFENAELALKQVKMKLPEASASQAAVVFGIMMDKVPVMQAAAVDTGNTKESAVSKDDVLKLAKTLVDCLEPDIVDAEFEVLDASE